jgi:hypothetical protein
MGYQVSDLRPFCRDLLALPGVSGVWLLHGASDRDGIVYVAVKGFDADAHERRIGVIRTIERYRATYREAMQESSFVFDYAVLVDDLELGEPHIPPAAEPIAA